jgi:hypothetical protein
MIEEIAFEAGSVPWYGVGLLGLGAGWFWGAMHGYGQGWIDGMRAESPEQKFYLETDEIREAVEQRLEERRPEDGQTTVEEWRQLQERSQ